MAQPTQAAPADATRYLPLLLVLFAGSGCSALIYETVWYQLLQLAIGSTAVSLGFLLATFMGGLCIGSRVVPAPAPGRAASAAHLCLPGTRHRRLRAAGASAAAAGEHGLHRRRRTRHAGLPAARISLRHLPAAADDSDGRIASRHRPLVEIHAQRRLLVRPALRRQHRGRGLRLPARRILPAAHLQHGDRHLRRRRHQRRGGAGQLRPGRPHTRRSQRTGTCAGRRMPPRSTPEMPPTTESRAGPSTSPSASPAPPRWAPRWCGPACSACCSA